MCIAMFCSAVLVQRAWALQTITIARTVARRFAEKGELVASFFFKAGQELRRDAGALFTTLATQLAIVMPDLRPSICGAIEKDPHISEKDPGRQWQDLIF